MNPTPRDSPRETLWLRAHEAGVQPVGATLLAIGAVLILAAFTVLNWFRDGSGFFAGAGSHSTFGDLNDLIASTRRAAAEQGISSHVSFGASAVYFGWLGWLLFLAAVVLTGLAVSRVGARRWFVKWLAAVVAAAGVGVSFLALNLVTFEGNAANNANAPSYGEFLGHSGLGAWAAIAGFVLIIVAALGPARG